MTPQEIPTDERILESLPDDIRAAVLTYVSESELTANAAIEGMLKHFLELDTSLSRGTARTAKPTSLLAILSPVIQSQAIQYAEQTEIHSELVIELAITHFLDSDSVTFDDCQVKVN